MLVNLITNSFDNAAYLVSHQVQRQHVAHSMNVIGIL